MANRLTAPIKLNITPEGLTWAAVAAGIVLRLIAYVDVRPLYRDERSLMDNLIKLAVFDFHSTLTEYQLAPPGFLAIERMLVRLPVDDVLAARAFPLACGIGSLFLFRAAARRFVVTAAVPVAMGLFAMSDWLIYYASEIKQYSSDLVLTLGALLLVPGPTPTSPRRLLCLGLFGAVGVWFSHPLVFVLAAVGSYAFATTVIRRDWRNALALAGIGLAWAASFAACFALSRGMLQEGPFIWDWWDFAFLRIPPHSRAELEFECWQLLNIFDSPADIKTPFGPLVTVFLALAMAVAGSVSLGRRWPGGLYLLLSPWAFVIVASTMRRYPFHGRLLIFLVPAIQMLVGEGAAAIGRIGGRRLAIALGVFLMFQPACDALTHIFARPINHDNFDSHGDIRPDLLDALRIEQRATGRSRR